ncbi:uncharacterized protein LOC119081716 isoform X2 [Bradysia coprophila]|uniref:uncharacterized protein LOC119081716 isoform X2 n=1 Tax=Bradysia coprophila TaxID=38358 RepID=UPI00187DB202|nr:uncharacterized protein LOC119081716 isoform X2 [Bradysia coprophila]
MLSFLKHFINYKPNMSKDVESVLNLSVIYENDEEIPDDGRVYHFYKYGESIEDTAMKVKLQLAEYRKILECLCQHSAEHQSMRKRLSKITKRTIAEQTINKCLVCNVPINLDKTSDFVTCDTCKQSPICKNLHCAIWSDKSKVWNCKLCRSYLHGSSSACDWLISQLNERLLQGKDNEDHSKIVWSSNDDSAPLIPLEQREKVREFVEELVSTLVGGTIDNAPVGQLFENKECLPTGENETDTIDQSHTNLKHLVERIIEEVFKIPELFDHSGVPKEPQRISLPQFDPKKYEELLATAVLNKLVESYSYERRFENSSGIHSGSDIDGNVQSILQKAQLETLSTSSSNEPRSDSSNSVSLNDQPMSLTATDFIGNLSRENSVFSPIDSPPQTPRSVGSDEEAYLSDYIQKHKVPLPGIDAHDSDSFDEDYQSVNSKDTEGNWQENWLFKKRKLKNEMKSDIGMLVPSPMEDVKALIGDKTTDEVSDLSEAGSDIEDEENGPMNGRRSADLPHALVESKTIIGGKNDFAAFPNAKTIDELLQPDSLVSTQSAESVDVQSPVIMEAKNDLILMNDCDSRPIILHVKEKQRNGSKSIDDSLINERACVQNGSSQSGVNQSAKPTSKDASITKGSLFDAEGVDPPVPTPRKKSKSLESAKETIAVEVPTQPTIQESGSLPDNNTIVNQIIREFDFSVEVDKLLGNKPQSLDDELLDSSINDIYDSIEGDPTLDYQSLIAENETVNTAVVSTSPEIILEASNLLIEDCFTETTQEISQDQLENNRLSSLNFIEPTSGPSSNISSENYICKVSPSEFDLSVDSALQPKSDIFDVIATNGVEDKSVPQAMYISSKPALIAVEIATHDTSTVQVINDDSEKKEPATSIPTLIISNICGDTPPPTAACDDDMSLKPKKVLRAQDSLELPPDDREKFEPTKRVDSFDLKDVDRKIDDKLEIDVDSEVNGMKSNTDKELSNAITDPEQTSEEDFVIVTEEEVKALKIEEEILLSTQGVGDSLTETKPETENSITSAYKDSNENKLESPNENICKDLIQTNEPELMLKQFSTNQSSGEIDEKHTTELSVQPESNEFIVMNTRKIFELPSIPESTTQTNEIERPSASAVTYTTSNLFISNQEIILNTNPSTNTIHSDEHGPLPGSIAEREHLKWMNAQVDIPNNPYSAEALQRRLSQTKSPSKVIDINLALAAKSIELDEDVTTKADNGKPLQIVLGAGEPDQLRYGRDYYINDSKAASGTRKKTSSIQRYSSTDEDNISSKPTTPDSDVFTARIVQIRDDPDQTSDDSTKLKLSITDRLSDNSSSLSLQSDSVQSDDSETRVYDLRKNETAYLRSDIIRTSRIPVGATTTPPPTPIDGESLHKNLDQFFAIQQLNQLKKSEEEQEATSQQKSQTFHSGRGVSKPLSPETLKFFTPKPKPVFTSKFKMEETAPIKPLILEREDAIPQNGTIEKGVIEEDVISSLPSVKALAKNFIEPSTETTKQPIQRPKTFAWQVSNEIGSNTNGHTKEPSPDSYLPNYETRYHPVAPGHSITARSLSTKFREELKHSISDDASNGSDNIEIVEREHSPDRPPSPVLLKGIFKEKMSFFQNLENK